MDDGQAAVVRNLHEQLAEAWTVTEATVRTDAAGNVRVSDVKVTENVRLAADVPSEGEDAARGDAALGGRNDPGDVVNALRLNFFLEDAFGEPEDLPPVAVLPSARADGTEDDAGTDHAGTADRIDLDAPVPSLAPDSPIPCTLPAEDLAPATSTMTPQTPDEREPALGEMTARAVPRSTWPSGDPPAATCSVPAIRTATPQSLFAQPARAVKPPAECSCGSSHPSNPTAGALRRR